MWTFLISDPLGNELQLYTKRPSHSHEHLINIIINTIINIIDRVRSYPSLCPRASRHIPSHSASQPCIPG